MVCNNLRRASFNCFISSIPVEVPTCHLSDKRASFRYSFNSTKQNGCKIMNNSQSALHLRLHSPTPPKKSLPKRQQRMEKTLSLYPSMCLDSFCKRKIAQIASVIQYIVRRAPCTSPIAERRQNTKRAGISERGNDVHCNKTQKKKERDRRAPEFTLKATPFQNSINALCSGNGETATLNWLNCVCVRISEQQNTQLGRSALLSRQL